MFISFEFSILLTTGKRIRAKVINVTFHRLICFPGFRAAHLFASYYFIFKQYYLSCILDVEAVCIQINLYFGHVQDVRP